MHHAGWNHLLIICLGLAPACDGGGQRGSTPPDAPAIADGDAPADAPSSPGCEADQASLGAEMYSATAMTCTVAIRLAHETRAIKGYQLFCGNYSWVTEQQARTLAEADTGFSGGPMLTSDHAYVFHELHDTPSSPSGVAVVGATVGRTVFGGSAVMGGTGDIAYPASWRPPDTLSTGCATTGDIASRIGFDLASGSELSSADIDAAVEVVRGTAIPAAMWSGGYVFNAIVLRYARSIEPFDPATAEWIVFVTGGWLE